MKAIVIQQPGGIEQLAVVERPDPQPGAGEVLVDVAYAGLNWADTQIRTGIYPHPFTYPLVPGFEISGTIAGLGAGVTGLKVGDRVCGFVEKGGGYAEKCVAPASVMIPLPAEVGFDVGAAFPIQALTAYHMMFTIYRLKRGDTVLINAIGGGVGLFCTQLAVHAGARVIGTVGTPGKEKKPLEYGAERVVLTSAENFEDAVLAFTGGKGVDLALDSLGAKTLDRTFGVVRKLGHIISIGEAEGLPYNNIRERILPRSQTFTRMHLGHIDPASQAWRDGVDHVMQGLRDGWLDVPIAGVFPFDQSGEMHRRIESRQVAGKLILKVRG
ncbi:MAG: zinc-binding alcohol dehydrogenase family protein [Rhodospirillaceae bacterium]